MRRRLIVLAVIVGVTVATAYYYFSGREYVFRLSEAQLQEKLAERLPVRKSYLIIFEVVLDNPRVALIDGSDRVNAGLDVILNIRLGDEPLPLGGSVDASGGIRYLSSTGEFFLTDPEVQRVAVQGIPEEYGERIGSILETALAEYYSDRPIYTLDVADPRQAAARLVLKSVMVEENELVITLGI